MNPFWGGRGEVSCQLGVCAQFQFALGAGGHHDQRFIAPAAKDPYG
jgi:hypothetical protein